MRIIRRKLRSAPCGLDNSTISPVRDILPEMPAQVHLTDEELNELCELTHVENAEEAVRSALAEYRRFARRMLLKGLSGQVMMQDNWRVMEDAEKDATGLG